MSVELANPGPAVLELLDRQCALFERLGALCARQAGLIESQQTELLLGLLEERRGLVWRIAEVAAQIEPLGAEWDRLTAAMTPAERDTVQVRLQRIADLSATVARRDEEDRRVLEARRDAIAAELAGVGRARGALAAYGAGGAPGPRYQDREA